MVEGKDIKAQMLTWNEQDVIAVEINDQREQPTDIRTNLRMLRSAVVKTGSHTATSGELFNEWDQLQLFQASVYGVLHIRPNQKHPPGNAIQLVIGGLG